MRYRLAWMYLEGRWWLPKWSGYLLDLIPGFGKAVIHAYMDRLPGKGPAPTLDPNWLREEVDNDEKDHGQG